MNPHSLLFLDLIKFGFRKEKTMKLNWKKMLIWLIKPLWQCFTSSSGCEFEWVGLPYVQFKDWYILSVTKYHFSHFDKTFNLCILPKVPDISWDEFIFVCMYVCVNIGTHIEELYQLINHHHYKIKKKFK